MLQPKKTKYRKQFRLRSQNRGIATKGTSFAFGEIGLRTISAGEISARQIEAARRVISRSVKRGGKVWIRIFPDKILTSKGAEMPMGKGKGAPDTWVAQVLPGKMLFEISGVATDLMKKSLKLASYKLCVKCKIVTSEI